MASSLHERRMMASAHLAYSVDIAEPSQRSSIGCLRALIAGALVLGTPEPMLAQETSTVTLREPYWMDCLSPSTRRACLANRDGTRADNRDDHRCAKDAAPRGPVVLGFMMVPVNPYTVTLTQFATTARKGDHWQEGQSFVGFPHRGNNADA